MVSRNDGASKQDAEPQPFIFDYFEEYEGAVAGTTTGSHSDIDGSDST